MNRSKLHTLNIDYLLIRFLGDNFKFTYKTGNLVIKMSQDGKYLLDLYTVSALSGKLESILTHLGSKMGNSGLNSRASNGSGLSMSPGGASSGQRNNGGNRPTKYKQNAARKISQYNANPYTNNQQNGQYRGNKTTYSPNPTNFSYIAPNQGNSGGNSYN